MQLTHDGFYPTKRLTRQTPDFKRPYNSDANKHRSTFTALPTPKIFPRFALLLNGGMTNLKWLKTKRLKISAGKLRQTQELNLSPVGVSTRQSFLRSPSKSQSIQNPAILRHPLYTRWCVNITGAQNTHLVGHLLWNSAREIIQHTRAESCT